MEITDGDIILLIVAMERADQELDSLGISQTHPGRAPLWAMLQAIKRKVKEKEWPRQKV